MTRATREPGNAGGSGGEHSPEEGWLWWQHSAQRSRAGPIPERGAQLESHLAGCCCALNSGVAGMGGIGIRDLAVRPPGWQEQGRTGSQAPQPQPPTRHISSLPNPGAGSSWVCFTVRFEEGEEGIETGDTENEVGVL